MFASNHPRVRNKNTSDKTGVLRKKVQDNQFTDNRSEAVQLRRFQELTPNNPTSNQVTQLQSEIKYNTTAFDLEDGSSELVGQKMEASLESADALKGSGPGDGVQSGLMGKLKQTGFKRMIRGHLLNGQCGGLGIATNLYPITAKANSLHKNHVENHIKDYIKKGNDVNYTVEVVNAQHKISAPGATFKCTATHPTTGKVLLDEQVASDPKKTAKSSKFFPEGGIANKTPSLSFPNSKVKSGWGEQGKGPNNSTSISRISSVSYNGSKQEVDLNKSSGFTNGFSFFDGKIDRREYASDLIDLFEDTLTDTESQEHFGVKIDELEDHADGLDDSGLEEMISQLELMLN